MCIQALDQPFTRRVPTTAVMLHGTPSSDLSAAWKLFRDPSEHMGMYLGQDPGLAVFMAAFFPTVGACCHTSRRIQFLLHVAQLLCIHEMVIITPEKQHICGNLVRHPF